MSGQTFCLHDNRLKLCADFVRNGARLADIGTDHAYLPIWLCKNNVCPSAIAADINPEPLSRGNDDIQSANMQDKVKTRLSNGLQNICENECDDIVIAGMGGELIAQIIDKCSFKRNPSKHFILQPMTKCEVLIKWLCDNNFEILKQDCCMASKKCYTVLLVQYKEEKKHYDEIFYFTGKLSPKGKNNHRLFLEKQLRMINKKALGDNHYLLIAEKLKEILE